MAMDTVTIAAEWFANSNAATRTFTYDSSPPAGSRIILAIYRDNDDGTHSTGTASAPGFTSRHSEAALNYRGKWDILTADADAVGTEASVTMTWNDTDTGYGNVFLAGYTTDLDVASITPIFGQASNGNTINFAADAQDFTLHLLGVHGSGSVTPAWPASDVEIDNDWRLGFFRGAGWAKSGGNTSMSPDATMGNMAFMTLHFDQDNAAPPAPVVTSTTHYSDPGTTIITTAGTIGADPDGDAITIFGRVNGGAWQSITPSAGNWTRGWGGRAPGPDVFEFYAEDPSGAQSATVTHTVTINDWAVPAITTADNQVVDSNDTTLTIDGTASDPGYGPDDTVVNVQLRIDGGSWQDATNTGTDYSTWTFTTGALSGYGLAQGDSFLVEVRAVDGFGTPGPGDSINARWNTAPAIVTPASIDGAQLAANSAMPDVTMTFSDADDPAGKVGRGYIRLERLSDGMFWNGANGLWQATSYFNNPSPTLPITGTHNSPHTYTRSIEWAGFSWPTDLGVSETYEWRQGAYDGAISSDFTAETYTFSTLALLPEVTMNDPLRSPNLDSSGISERVLNTVWRQLVDASTYDGVQFSGTATSNGSTIVAVQYRLDGGTWTAANTTNLNTATTTFTVTLDPLAYGSHLLEFRAEDALGEFSLIASQTMEMNRYPHHTDYTQYLTTGTVSPTGFTINGVRTQVVTPFESNPVLGDLDFTEQFDTLVDDTGIFQLRVAVRDITDGTGNYLHWDWDNDVWAAGTDTAYDLTDIDPQSSPYPETYTFADYTVSDPAWIENRTYQILVWVQDANFFSAYQGLRQSVTDYAIPTISPDDPASVRLPAATTDRLITGSAAANSEPITSVEVSLNGGTSWVAATITSGAGTNSVTWEYNLTGLTEGTTQAVNMRANTANKTSGVNGRTYVVNTLPTAAFTFPGPNTVVAAGLTFVSATASDDDGVDFFRLTVVETDPDLGDVRWLVDTTPTWSRTPVTLADEAAGGGPTESLTWPNIPAEPGRTYRLELAAVDSDGEVGPTQTETYEAAATNPSVVFDAPSDPFIEGTDKLEGTADDYNAVQLVQWRPSPAGSYRTVDKADYALESSLADITSLTGVYPAAPFVAALGVGYNVRTTVEGYMDELFDWDGDKTRYFFSLQRDAAGDYPFRLYFNSAGNMTSMRLNETASEWEYVSTSVANMGQGNLTKQRFRWRFTDDAVAKQTTVERWDFDADQWVVADTEAWSNTHGAGDTYIDFSDATNVQINLGNLTPAYNNDNGINPNRVREGIHFHGVIIEDLTNSVELASFNLFDNYDHDTGTFNETDAGTWQFNGTNPQSRITMIPGGRWCVEDVSDVIADPAQTVAVRSRNVDLLTSGIQNQAVDIDVPVPTLGVNVGIATGRKHTRQLGDLGTALTVGPHVSDPSINALNGRGYIMWTEEDIFEGSRFTSNGANCHHLIPVHYNTVTNQWMYDNNATFLPFTPRPSDRIIGWYTTSANDLIDESGLLVDNFNVIEGIQSGIASGHDIALYNNRLGSPTAVNNGEIHITGTSFDIIPGGLMDDGGALDHRIITAEARYLQTLDDGTVVELMWDAIAQAWVANDGTWQAITVNASRTRWTWPEAPLLKTSDDGLTAVTTDDNLQAYELQVRLTNEDGDTVTQTHVPDTDFPGVQVADEGFNNYEDDRSSHTVTWTATDASGISEFNVACRRFPSHHANLTEANNAGELQYLMADLVTWDTGTTNHQLSLDIEIGAASVNASLTVPTESGYRYEFFLNTTGTLADFWGNSRTWRSTSDQHVAVIESVPVTVDDVDLSTPQDVPLDIDALANDIEVFDGVVVTVTQPANGTAVVQGTGTGSTILYTPPAGYVGPSSFFYTVTNVDTGTDTGQINIQVGPTDNEIARAILENQSRLSRRVDLLNNDGSLFAYDVRTTDGSVSIDGNRSERRRADLTLYDLGDLGQNEDQFWYDKIVRVYRGLEVNGASYLPIVFTGRVELFTRDHFSNGLTIACRDMSKDLNFTFGTYEEYAANSPVENVIRDIAIAGGLDPARINLPLTGLNTPDEPIVYTPEANRWEAMRSLAQTNLQDLYFDADGILVMRDMPRDSDNTVEYAFGLGEDGNIGNNTTKQDDKSIFNIIVVVGDTSGDEAEIVGTAELTDGPTGTAVLGRRPKVVKREGVRNEAHAVELAGLLLEEYTRESFDITSQTIPDPRLEANSLATFERPGSLTTAALLPGLRSTDFSPDNNNYFQTRVFSTPADTSGLHVIEADFRIWDNPDANYAASAARSIVSGRAGGMWDVIVNVTNGQVIWTPNSTGVAAGRATTNFVNDGFTIPVADIFKRQTIRIEHDNTTFESKLYWGLFGEEPQLVATLTSGAIWDSSAFTSTYVTLSRATTSVHPVAAEHFGVTWHMDGQLVAEFDPNVANLLSDFSDNAGNDWFVEGDLELTEVPNGEVQRYMLRSITIPYRPGPSQIQLSRLLSNGE